MRILKKNFDFDKPTIKRQISLTAPDITTLLIDFLNEVLYLANVHKEIYKIVKFNNLEKNQLVAVLEGSSINSFDEDIKAVTYHQADVHQNQAEEWQTKIVYDI